MSWEKPTPADVWKAIDCYLTIAYDGPPPSAVSCRLSALRAEESLYACAALERTPRSEPTRYDLRLGNRWYPHMKLVIECSPDGARHLFRADTHDRHIRPTPGSRDDSAFREMVEKNCVLSARIESAWDELGLPTFKRYLREDLARRRYAASP